jgi:hypothetical protein
MARILSFVPRRTSISAVAKAAINKSITSREHLDHKSAEIQISSSEKRLSTVKLLLIIHNKKQLETLIMSDDAWRRKQP